jgi:hypothetical protein
MNYCIGCEHFYYDPGMDGYHYSSWTHSNGSPPSSSCKKGHWSEEMDEAFTQEKFQAAMEQAETCADFSERDTDKPGAES